MYLLNVDLNPADSAGGTLMIVALCVTGWMIMSRVTKSACRRLCGDQICYEGATVWLSAYKLVTQAAVLPCLFYFMVDSCEWGSNPCSSAVSSPWLDATFVGCFFLFIMDDFVSLYLDVSMLLHHGACLVGICIGYALNHAGFYYFAAGITAFELGSGSLNLYCLNRKSDLLLAIYAAGMTLSNVIGTYCSALWFLSVPSTVKRIVGALLTVLLVLFRQINLSRTWRIHIARRQLLRERVFSAVDRDSGTATADGEDAGSDVARINGGNSAEQVNAIATLRQRHILEAR